MTTKIIGTGSAVPDRVVTNDDLAKIVETSDEWIRSRTGILERRIAEAQSGTTDLAIKAAKAALEDSGISADELDIIILATSTPDRCFPSGACEVQAAIGAHGAIAFDLSAACSGFIYGFHTISAFFQAGIYKTGLVIGADTLSKLIDWTDRGSCVLFGDGAGAAVVRAEETGTLYMTMGADGTRGNALDCVSRTTGNFLTGQQPETGYMSMDGQEVFRFAVKTVPEAILEVLSESRTDLSEIKYFILHQANYRIFESIAKRLKVPMEKFPTNLERYGNTSGASVPLLLDELNRAGELKQGDKIVLAGFGAGLTWGATLMEW
ncbi:beta-ketoacyl-ACP synthase III [Clostridium boliviensis]|uniref:Beta-ketoacyl-[acyl-carrier-protein] synthase III n=1 Tax=Clostridium boliviensis TaxID=318465 RepID=A0ABU4GHN4_9CLOT|nr:beta-ketoacyl-ACP synthase III [Clostridium boliviensis]MDW2797101.1 beta-ketoacyl-ACP synthase III [Clostridium boliviensis]